MGGVSPEPYDSLNLSFHVPDDPANVLVNREILSQEAGFPLETLVTSQQVGGANVAVVTAGMKGRGSLDDASAIPSTDAMMTNVEGLNLMVLLADCVPVFLYDPEVKVVAIAHAGWRGTVENVTANTLAMMKHAFGCRPSDIVAGIGPSIGPCCYDIGPEVVERVKPMYEDSSDVLGPTAGGKAYFDLWKANEIQLLRAGVRQANIEVARVCTKCNSELFFSERKQKPTGRFGAAIGLL